MNVSKPSSKTGYFNFYNQSEPQREAVLKTHVLIISMLQLSPSKSNDLFRPPSLPVLPCSRWRDDRWNIFKLWRDTVFKHLMGRPIKSLTAIWPLLGNFVYADLGKKKKSGRHSDSRLILKSQAVNEIA